MRLLTLFIIFILTISLPNNQNLNTLLNKMENYYTSNQINQFKLTMDLIKEIAIENNQNEKVIEFLKQKIINQGYQNPFLTEQLGDTIFDLGDYELAEKLYIETTKYLNPSSKISSSILSRLFFKTSQINLLQGQIQDYINNLNKSYLYEIDPENKINLKTQIIKDQITYLGNPINPTKITNQIKELIEKSNTLPTEQKEKIYISLVEIYSNLNMEDEARKIVEKILPQFNTSSSIITQYQFTKDKEKQKQLLERLVKEYPKIDSYYIEQLANLYYEENNIDKAKELYIHVITAIPTKYYLLYKLAKISLEQKNLYDAKKYIDLALKQTEDPGFFELAGDIYQKIDKNKAIEFYQKAYELYNDIKDKAKIRQKISNLQN